MANGIIENGLSAINSIASTPIGLSFFFVLIFKIFGHDNMIALHGILILWTTLTSLICFGIAKRVYGERVGIIAAVLFTLFSTSYKSDFIATSSTLLMILPLSLSFYYLIGWAHNTKLRSLWLSGFLFGIACLFEYHTIIYLVSIAILSLFITPLVKGISHFITGLKCTIHFLLGLALLFLLCLVAVFALDLWGNLDHLILNTIFDQQVFLISNRVINALHEMAWFIPATIFIWYFGIRECLRFSGENLLQIFLINWFCFSLLVVLIAYTTESYHLIQILPPLCILAAKSVSEFFSWLANARPVRLKHQIIYSVFLAFLLIPAIVALGFRTGGDVIKEMIGKFNHIPSDALRKID
ncbi:MAG: glycosyltransferase family 39 protein [Pseudomonadota bacterium]